MKKRSFLKLGLAFASLAAFAGGLVACDEGNDYVDLRIDRSAYIFRVGETMELNVLDGNDEVSDVTWSSTKPAFATVDSNGVITAISAGATEIKAIVGDKELVCAVLVKDRLVEFLSDYDVVQIDTDENTDRYPTSIDLDVIVDVNRVNTDIDVTWSSADPTVATVENGVVSALNKGTTTVTASVVIEGVTSKRDFNVFVYPQYVQKPNNPAFLISTEVDAANQIEFDYTGTGAIDFVELNNQRLDPTDYEISDGKFILKEVNYTKSRAIVEGRYELSISEEDTSTDSFLHTYPFVLADYIVDSAESLAAMPAFITQAFKTNQAAGTQENNYIVLGADIDFGGKDYTMGTTYFRYSTFDGYGNYITNINFKSWGLLGNITQSTVKDLALIDVTAAGNSALCGTMQKNAEIVNVFCSGTGSANFLLAGSVARVNAVGYIKDSVVIDYSNLGGSTAKGALGRIQYRTKIDGNVIVTDGYALANMDTGEEALVSDFVDGLNYKVAHSDKAGLIEALKTLAELSPESWSFDETTNELSLCGNVVYKVVTE